MENNMIYEVARNYTILEDYKEASESSVKEIRKLLKHQNLKKHINIKYDDIKLEINFNSMSKYHPSQKLRLFHMDNNTNAITFENKPFMLYMYIGPWSNNDSVRIKNSHISIYTNSSKIGGERFFQIELSDCIEDDKYVYMLKNISKNAGSGAISRLNKNSYPTTEREKRDNDLRKRREELVRRTYSEVINYNNNDWICIYKFDKEKLFELSYHEEIFNECIESMINFTFAMESIVVEAKKFGTFITPTKKVNNISFFDYISISECAIDIGLEAYNIKIYSDGKIEGYIYNKKTTLRTYISNKEYLSIETVMNISKEIKDFDLKNFELVESEHYETYYQTCQPIFYMEVKYTDGITKEIYYDYGRIYENALGSNKIDILKLKHNLEQILNIKSLDNLMKI